MSILCSLSSLFGCFLLGVDPFGYLGSPKILSRNESSGTLISNAHVAGFGARISNSDHKQYLFFLFKSDPVLQLGFGMMIGLLWVLQSTFLGLRVPKSLEFHC